MNPQDIDYLGTHLSLDVWTIHTTKLMTKVKNVRGDSNPHSKS